MGEQNEWYYVDSSKEKVQHKRKSECMINFFETRNYTSGFKDEKRRE